MTTYAGIKDGIVRQTFTPLPEWGGLDPATLFHSDLFDEWVSLDGVDPKPESGWTYDGGAFAPPPAVEDADARRTWAIRVGLLREPT
jgi:hypothetical protein